VEKGRATRWMRSWELNSFMRDRSDGRWLTAEIDKSATVGKEYNAV